MTMDGGGKMAVLNDLPKFFLAAKGRGSEFESAYSAETGWRVWLLKGGPTVGKSILLKKLAAALCERGEDVTLIPDLHDPKAPGGVIVQSLGVAFFDGDAPGYLAEKYPVVCERIVDFAPLLDEKLLDRFRPKIIGGLQAAGQGDKRADAYLAAGAALLEDARNLAAACADTRKAEKFAEALAGRLIPKGTGGGESIRFLSGITPLGLVHYRSTVAKLCGQVYTISDEWGAVSAVILRTIRRVALERGARVITCPCPLFPQEKIDHILLPDAGIAFVTANRYLEEVESVRRYHARRFSDAAALRRHTQRMKFCKKAAADLLDSAADLLSGAAAERELVRGYYDAALNYDALTPLAEKLLAELPAPKN